MKGKVKTKRSKSRRYDSVHVGDIAPKGHFRRAGRFPKYRFQHVRPSNPTRPDAYEATWGNGWAIAPPRPRWPQRLEGVWEWFQCIGIRGDILGVGPLAW